MADTPSQPEVVVLNQEQAAAPAEAAPQVAEANPPAEQPAAEAPAAAAPEAVVEAPAAEAEKPASVADTPSLLEDEKPAEAKAGEKPAADAKAEEKPAEKAAEAKTEEAKPAEVKAEEKPAEPEKPAPVEYKFELPEAVNMTDEQRGEFTGMLDAFRADPANVQPLVDYHVARLTEAVEAVTRGQHEQFNETRRQWNDLIKGDEIMGGSGFETTKKAVARMRDMLVSSHQPGTPEYDRETQEFVQFCRITGAGDHPCMWRLLHNAARYFDEAELPPVEARPAPGGKQPGSRRGLLYNHPTSPNNKD